MCPCTMKNALVSHFVHVCIHAVSRRAHSHESPSVAPLALHAGPPGTTVYAELGTVVHLLMCM